MELQKGTLLKNGEYQIKKKIGQGGFGITYLASAIIEKAGNLKRMTVEADVVIKEFYLKDYCSRDKNNSVIVTSHDNENLVEKYREKFEQEAKKLSKMNHPNIVEVNDVIVNENETVYYVMRYLEGGTLQKLVRPDEETITPLEEEEKAVRYIRQIASALDYMHQRKMCHYDVKPSNIMLDKSDNAVLIDFGLAKNYTKSGEQTSTLLGGATIGYAPLEQANANLETFSPQTDIYALGATMYFLLTGHAPKAAAFNLNEVLPEGQCGISITLWEVIKKCMQANPDDRPQDMVEFLSLIGENGSTSDNETLPISKQQHNRIFQFFGYSKDTHSNSIESSPFKNISFPSRFRVSADLINPITLVFISLSAIVSIFFGIAFGIEGFNATDIKRLITDTLGSHLAMTGTLICVITLGGKKWGIYLMAFVLLVAIILDALFDYEGIGKTIETIFFFFSPLIIMFFCLKLKKKNKSYWNLMEGELKDRFSITFITIWLLGTALYASFFIYKKSTLDSIIIQQNMQLNELVQNLEKDMIHLDGGSFIMGATQEQGNGFESDERPTHKVTVRDFSISKFEVSQKLWTAVMGANPSYKIGEDMPVENVSWDDCQEFIQKLNEISGKNYRLPTEAEWEFAARGGKRSKHYRYAGSNKLDEVAWTHNNSGDSLHAMGLKKPNELGLYDMSGNVLEWCQDYYGDYSEIDQLDPQGAKTGENRVCRGGGYGNAKQSRISYRLALIPTDKYADVGFRLAESISNTKN